MNDIASWQSLTSAVTLALFLSAVVLPILKGIGVTGRGTLVAGLLAGQVLAQAAVALTKGFSYPGAFDALLLGLVAAATATGLYAGKQTVIGK